MGNLRIFILAAAVLFQSSIGRAELNCGVHFEDLRERQRQPPVELNLHAALEKGKKQKPVEYIEFGGIKLPKYSKTSKWRVVVVEPKEDSISRLGYESGWDRYGAEVPDHLQAKYNKATGKVNYEFADGRSVEVTPEEARALEFSYIDSKNPMSPLNGLTVGLHDDPEKIIKIARQARAEKLISGNAYIRIDEVETSNLKMLSAEQLYDKFTLRNPKYSPKGEWVVDHSIPVENLVNTYKFKSISTIKETEAFVPDEIVAYEAISGVSYMAKVESKVMRDDYVTVYYVDRYGRKHMDIAHISKIKKQADIVSGNFELQLNRVDIEDHIEQGHFDVLGQALKANPELGPYFKSPSSVPNKLIVERALNVMASYHKMFKSYYDLKGIVIGADERELISLVSKAILMNEIGLPLASALKASGEHLEFTQPIAKRFFEQLHMRDEDVKFALGLIKRRDFDNVITIDDIIQLRAAQKQ